MRVSLIGLGMMGRAMARNLVTAGHEVSAWNRSPVASEMRDGIRMLSSPAEAFAAEAVITMLSDDDAVRATLLDSDALTGARPGCVHVVTATISLAFARELAERHRAVGIAYVSAPVLGRPDVAARGELNILAAGPRDAVARVCPLLEILSRKVWDLGEEPACANAAKIACNMMIAMAIEAMAEGVVLTESVGLDRAEFFNLILGTLFSGRAYESYSAQITKRSFEPGFKARLALKDMHLATEASNQIGRTLPMLEAVREGLSRAVSAGLGEKDWSIMADMTVRGSDSLASAENISEKRQ